jgi:hypothetical protein
VCLLAALAFIDERPRGQRAIGQSRSDLEERIVEPVAQLVRRLRSRRRRQRAD